MKTPNSSPSNQNPNQPPANKFEKKPLIPVKKEKEKVPPPVADAATNDLLTAEFGDAPTAPPKRRRFQLRAREFRIGLSVLGALVLLLGYVAFVRLATPAPDVVGDAAKQAPAPEATAPEPVKMVSKATLKSPTASGVPSISLPRKTAKDKHVQVATSWTDEGEAAPSTLPAQTGNSNRLNPRSTPGAEPESAPVGSNDPFGRGRTNTPSVGTPRMHSASSNSLSAGMPAETVEAAPTEPASSPFGARTPVASTPFGDRETSPATPETSSTPAGGSRYGASDRYGATNAGNDRYGAMPQEPAASDPAPAVVTEPQPLAAEMPSNNTPLPFDSASPVETSPVEPAPVGGDRYGALPAAQPTTPAAESFPTEPNNRYGQSASTPIPAVTTPFDPQPMEELPRGTPVAQPDPAEPAPRRYGDSMHSGAPRTKLVNVEPFVSQPAEPIQPLEPIPAREPEPVAQPERVVVQPEPVAQPQRTVQPERVVQPERASPPAREPFNPTPVVAQPTRTNSEPDNPQEVQLHDTYYKIAERVYGSGQYYRALSWHNRQRLPQGELLRVGDKISAPPLDQLQQLYPDLIPKTTISASTAATGSGNYRVQNGDTLFDIARHELGQASRWVEIYDMNRDLLGERIDELTPGTELRLPAPSPNRAATGTGAAPRMRFNR